MHDTKLMIIVAIFDYLDIRRSDNELRPNEGYTMNLYIESLEGGNYLASTGMGASRTLVRDNQVTT